MSQELGRYYTRVGVSGLGLKARATRLESTVTHHSLYLVTGSWNPRGLTLSPEWLFLWLGAEGLSSGNRQLPSYRATKRGPARRRHTIPARLPRPNNPHGTHYNLARQQQQRVSAAGQRGPPPPKAQSCPS